MLGVRGLKNVALIATLFLFQTFFVWAFPYSQYVTRAAPGDITLCSSSLSGEAGDEKSVYITEPDIENVVTAKAAIFAAIKILIRRLDMHFQDIERFFLAGAFGNYINIENAIAIGLVPNIERDRIMFVGNTAIRGAKMAAFYREGFKKITEIRRKTTYYDLMGADDYVEEFQKAMFLPHTDIELFQAS